MDRLPSLIAGCLLAAVAGGCEKQESTAPEGAAHARVNAVAAKPAAEADLDAFCDRRFAADAAPRLEPLPLADDAAWPRADSGWQWINVWATWCKPCVEEMPRLQRWQKELVADGVPLSLDFVSADVDDETVADFRARHPEVPDGVRLADPDALPGWLASLSPELGAVLPVHVFVDERGTVRCVRAAGVEDADRDEVEALLRGDG